MAESPKTSRQRDSGRTGAGCRKLMGELQLICSLFSIIRWMNLSSVEQEEYFVRVVAESQKNFFEETNCYGREEVRKVKLGCQ
jgi:hypothetical protein